ncbi:hypothetical protein WS65_11675 [Burkholderia anthina]|nr:hypothetical protein WS65_11675 [Burkholderia anthina]
MGHGGRFGAAFLPPAFVRRFPAEGTMPRRRFIFPIAFSLMRNPTPVMPMIDWHGSCARPAAPAASRIGAATRQP